MVKPRPRELEGKYHSANAPKGKPSGGIICLKKKVYVQLTCCLRKIFCCDVGNNFGFFVGAWDAGGGSDGGKADYSTTDFCRHEKIYLSKP